MLLFLPLLLAGGAGYVGGQYLQKQKDEANKKLEGKDYILLAALGVGVYYVTRKMKF